MLTNPHLQAAILDPCALHSEVYRQSGTSASKASHVCISCAVLQSISVSLSCLICPGVPGCVCQVELGDEVIALPDVVAMMIDGQIRTLGIIASLHLVKAVVSVLLCCSASYSSHFTPYFTYWSNPSAFQSAKSSQPAQFYRVSLFRQLKDRQKNRLSFIPL